MTLTELRYIVTLAQEKHFGRAAEKCFVSQPTLSVAVKKLEDELGVALFERSKGQITVTVIGERFVNQAHKVLDQANVLKDIAQGGKDQLGVPLRVGAIYTVGPYLFPHLIPQLRAIAPQMPLYVEESYTATLREKLRQTELDAIVVALPFHEPDVVTLPLYEEPFVVLLPAGHPLAALERIHSDALLADNLLMLGPGHCFRDQVFESCPALLKAVSTTRADDAPHGLITEGSSLETIRHMVASGLGISILPLSAAGVGQYQEDVLTIRPFADNIPKRTVGLAWRVTFPRPNAIDVVARAASSCRLSTAPGILPADISAFSSSNQG
ncbi:MAG: hydrogen peroxide-inducible genes activator [Hahellaceae bacterium]|nr:hydrogen peroxide-inducible genes activator [Hahellaceae bacterium]MCP5168464.1 hydrogen peroxide-inducible genes activator [Hahellaceae bacterium]